MKIFGVLLVLGLMDACLGRSMKPATIKKRFREAKYAFKFRVVSKPTGECFPGPSAVTTPETTSTTTTTSTTAPTTKMASTDDATQGTTTISFSTTRTTNPPTYGTSTGPSTNAVEETLTDHLVTVQMQTTTTTSTSPDETNKMPSTSVTSNLPESITNAPVVTTGQQNSVQNSLATREKPSSKPASTLSPTKFETAEEMSKKKTSNETAFLTKQPKTLPPDNKNSSANTSDGMEAGRKKRSCEMMVYHQDIIIGRKHIYKACDEINEMKRVDGMNKKYLKSTIRLQLDFYGLKPNRNYFFMGRAVPGQDTSDYVFMADELTVVNWKSSAWKLKKYLRSNGDRCN